MKECYSGKIKDLPTADAGTHMLGGEKRIVFGPERFWPTHVMRCFTLQPGGMAANNHHPLGALVRLHRRPRQIPGR